MRLTFPDRPRLSITRYLPEISALLAALLVVVTGVVTIGRLFYLTTSNAVSFSLLLNRLLNDQRLMLAASNTVRFASLSLLLQFALPLLLLRFVRTSPDFVKLLLIFPALVSTSTASIAWLLLLSPAIGPMDEWLRSMSIMPPLWFVEPLPMNALTVSIDTWQWLPFVTAVLLHQSGQIPGRFYSQARIEGASEWRIWRTITLPLLAPTILILLAIRCLDLLRSYDLHQVLFGGGGPGNSMETISVYTLRLIFQPGNQSYAGLVTLVYLLLALLLLAGLISLPPIRRWMPWNITSPRE